MSRTFHHFNLIILLFFSCLIIPGCISEAQSPLASPESQKENNYCSEAIELISQKKYDEAMTLLDKATARDGSDATPYILKADICFKQKKYNESINYAAAAINLNPGESDPYLYTEKSLLRLGLNDKGISYMGTIISDQENKTAPEDTKVKIRINLCKNDQENYEFWKKWNRINLWETPGGNRYIGTTNACDDVEIYVISLEKSEGQTYYKIREANRDLEGWI